MSVKSRFIEKLKKLREYLEKHDDNQGSCDTAVIEVVWYHLKEMRRPTSKDDWKLSHDGTYNPFSLIGERNVCQVNQGITKRVNLALNVVMTEEIGKDQVEEWLDEADIF